MNEITYNLEDFDELNSIPDTIQAKYPDIHYCPDNDMNCIDSYSIEYKFCTCDKNDLIRVKDLQDYNLTKAVHRTVVDESGFGEYIFHTDIEKTDTSDIKHSGAGISTPWENRAIFMNLK